MKQSLTALIIALGFCVRLAAGTSVDVYKQQLLAADKAFSDAAAKLGVMNAFLSVAAPDVKLLDEVPRGGEAIRAAYSRMKPTSTLSWVPSEAEVSSDGSLGYTWGRYKYGSLSRDGKLQVEMGTYVTIWRRQPDGTWKVVLDGGNPD